MRWVTTEQVQIDRMSSAWLIRRFVDPEATFAVVPRGTEADAVTDGTPFYLPGSTLGRSANQSTFETIVAHYELANDHPTLVPLGHLLRAVDALHGTVMFRKAAVRDALPADAPLETAGVQLVLQGIRLISPDDDTAIATAMGVLDAIYRALTERTQAA